MAGRKARPVMDRFMERIDNHEPDRCWNWTGHKAGGALKYGRFFYDGRLQQANRVSYMIHIGPIPDGMEVCHNCDNSLCVNPHHLWVGTHQQNLQDCSRKGRIVTSLPSSGKYNRQKLDADQVLEVVDLLKQGWTHGALGERFGVSQTAITHINLGITFAYITGATRDNPIVKY